MSDYMHPILEDDVTIELYEFPYEYTLVRNREGSEFYYPVIYYDILSNMDGTKEFRVPGYSGLESKVILNEIEKSKILRTHRRIKEGVVDRYTLLPIGKKRNKAIYRSALIVNKLLPYWAIIALISSVILLVFYPKDPVGDFSMFLYYVLLILSLCIHELGHFCAAIAYRQEVSEIGLLVLGFIPVGAYVSISLNENRLKSKDKNQIFLAGAEMDVICISILTIIHSMSTYETKTIFIALISNILIAMVNLQPTLSLDGELLLSSLLKTNDIQNKAKRIILNKKNRRILYKNGMAGIVVLSIYLWIYISKMLLLLFLILSVILGVMLL